METVSRVGPCEAEIKLNTIRDIRETKRKQIIERAAELLKEWDNKSLETSEIEEQIDTDIKLGEIIKWGPEKLPAGPEVEIDENLIIVEGRADVLNLLRIGIKNTVAVQGTQVPKSVIDLIKEKESVVAFLDGDRGGDLILKELMQLAKIDEIARAPDGYEVEELTRKQMIKSLQNKKSVSSYMEGSSGGNGKNYTGKAAALYHMLKDSGVSDETVLMDAIKSIDSGQCKGYNEDLDVLFEMPAWELFDNMREHEDVRYIIIDGILSKRLLSLAINMNVKFIACKNKEEDLHIPDRINVFFY